MRYLAVGFLCIACVAFAQTALQVTQIDGTPLRDNTLPISYLVDDPLNPTSITPNGSPSPIVVDSAPSQQLVLISPIVIGTVGQWLNFAVVDSSVTDCSTVPPNSYVQLPGVYSTPARICVEAVETSPPLRVGYDFGSLTVTRGSASLTVGIALSVFPTGYLQLTDPYGTSFNMGQISFPLAAGKPQPPVFINVLKDNNGVVTDNNNDANAQLDLRTSADDGSPAPWIVYSLTDPQTGAPTSTSPAKLNISIDQGRLPAGQSSVSGRIFLASEGTYQGTDYIQVTTTVPMVGGVTVAPQSLSFSYQQSSGTLPSSKPIRIDSSPEGFQFSVGANAGWVQFSSSSGNTPATVQVSIDPRQLPLGYSTAQIQISAGSAMATGTVSVNVTSGPAGNYFVPLTPCRVVDTRNANGALGGPSIAGGTFRSFRVSASTCGIPSTATAYSLNVAVVPHGSLGYLTLWPAGTSQPVVSTLNSFDGRIKSNAAIVPAGSNGAVSVFATNTTDVILDINGYFAPGGSAGALAFYPLTPCRIADTRNPLGPLGGPRLMAGGDRSFPVRSSMCDTSSAAQAYSLNFTVVPRGNLGYLTVWPSGLAMPLASALNDPLGITTANAVIVPAGAGGAVSVYATGNTDLVVDIDGDFAPSGPEGLALYTLQPCRILDTRQGTGAPPVDSTISVNVSASTCGVPSTAQAYVLNVTVVPTRVLGFVTIWPEGQPRPLASTLNAPDGAITSNMAIVPTANGSISVFVSEPTHLILDISGYFAH